MQAGRRAMGRMWGCARFGKFLFVNTVRSIINRAHDYYFNQWRGSEKVCPAFGEKILSRASPLSKTVIGVECMKLKAFA